MSHFFGPNSKMCTCKVRAAWGRVSRGLTVHLFRTLEYLTPKTYSREQYDFIIHKEESYFELLVIFKSWLHWFYSFLSCPSAKIPTLKKLTFVPFCITRHKWLIQLQSKCRKKGKYILGKWFLINMSQIRVVNRI